MFNLMLLGGIDGKGVRVPTPWCFPGQRTQPRKTVREKSTQISKRLWKHKTVIEKRNCAAIGWKLRRAGVVRGWHTDTLFWETINMTWHDLLAGRRPPAATTRAAVIHLHSWISAHVARREHYINVWRCRRYDPLTARAIHSRSLAAYSHAAGREESNNNQLCNRGGEVNQLFNGDIKTAARHLMKYRSRWQQDKWDRKLLCMCSVCVL